MKRFATGCLAIASLAICTIAHASVFNGAGDYQTDEHGYYYAVVGGLFPTGPDPNGASGTFRRI